MNRVTTHVTFSIFLTFIIYPTVQCNKLARSSRRPAEMLVIFSLSKVENSSKCRLLLPTTQVSTLLSPKPFAFQMSYCHFSNSWPEPESSGPAGHFAACPICLAGFPVWPGQNPGWSGPQSYLVENLAVL